MLSSPEEFKAWRVSVPRVDGRLFKDLFSISCQAANRAIPRYQVFALPSEPNFTWQKRRSPNDVELGINAFPRTTDGKRTHIQLSGETNPNLVVAGMIAVVGAAEIERPINLWVMSTNGQEHWVTSLRQERPIETTELDQLMEDLART